MEADIVEAAVQEHERDGGDVSTKIELAAHKAKQFLRTVPAWLLALDPMCYVDSDEDVSIDWCPSRRFTLTVCIRFDGTVFYALLVDGVSRSGTITP